MSTTKPVSPFGVGTARLSDYLGPWAIQPERAASMLAMVRRLDIRAHLASDKAAAAAAAAKAALAGGARFGDGPDEDLTDDGTATISMSGTLMKAVSSLDSGTSTVAVRRSIRRAADDARVARVLMIIDSPGGTVSGTSDLADDVAALSDRKPTAAYCEDLCCSAAYWVASQCRSMSAGRSALVGSIGALMAVADYSKAAEKAGIKVHVITSTGAETFKGAGIEGSEISDDQLANWKGLLDQLNAHFLAAVAKGRKLDAKTVAGLADGRVHIADDARKLRLIDAVESLDDCRARLCGSAGASGRSMSAATTIVPFNFSPTPTPTAAPPVETETPTMTTETYTARTAQAELDRRVAEHLASRPRMTRADAALAIFRADDDFHRAFLAAHQPAAVAAPAGGNAEMFTRRVAGLVAAGVPRQEAIFSAARSDPAGHRAWILAQQPPPRK